MAVNYDDKRFQEVEKQQNSAIKETQNTYNEMINNSNKYYQQQIDASKDWANKQTELQQAQTDFTIEKVEQQKQQAEKDYIKEQKGAYTDYQKATNQYGVNAEKLASQGLNQTGYSESTRTNAYNTYQNRYMTARESYNQAILNYDNSIKEAQLANSSALAQIAYEALQTQLELSLQGFQYKNQLVLQKLDAVNAEKDRYYQRYQNVLQQINTENALAEEIRQYNASLAEQKRQYNENLAFQKAQAKQEQANWEKEYALTKKKITSSSSSGGSSSSRSGGSSSSNGSINLKDSTSNSSSIVDTAKSMVSSIGNSIKNAFVKAVNGGNSSSKNSSGTIKLSNGKKAYENPVDAYKANGGKEAYSWAMILKKGLVSSIIYNDKRYYY